MNILQSLLLSAIGVYRKAISPFLPASCRFYPSCSQYAKESIEKYGAARGVLKSLLRIGRCHPWNPGGIDPVEGPDYEEKRAGGQGHEHTLHRAI